MSRLAAVVSISMACWWTPRSCGTSFAAALRPKLAGPGPGRRPGQYRAVLQRLGVHPAQTVAIEDSSNGMRSAAAAGLAVLAVPNKAFPPSEDALALAEVVVGSLDEITAELVASMSRRR